jgi:hypothetical protein
LEKNSIIKATLVIITVHIFPTFQLLKSSLYNIKSNYRGVAQPGSAPGLGPGGRVFESHRPDHLFMRKAKIYKPTKTAMQSGKRNSKNWLLEFDTLNTSIYPLMGWESSNDTMSEVKLEFLTKEQAVNYAQKNKIEYYIVDEQKRKFIKKSYTDNFLK